MSMVEMLTNSAAEPAEIVTQDSDQLEDTDSVSLSEVLSEGTDNLPADAGEEATGEAEIQEGDAGPQPEQQQDKTFTQAEFDRAFGQRANGLRKQFQREHQADLDLASLIKRAYPGKSLDEIQDEMLRAEAHRVAEETGWDEDEALEKVKARKRFERSGDVAEQPDPHLMELKKQLQQVNQREGVDMLAIIEQDEYLSEQIDNGSMDIKDAYAYYLKNRSSAGAPHKAVPVVSQRSGAKATGDRKLTDAEFRRIDESLKRGLHVRLD